MRITWNSIESVFVADFSSDFSGDLDAVKTAGFRTYGAPHWVWYAPSPGIKALERLKKSPPKSGLLITELALEKYKLLKQQYDKKVELKKEFQKMRTAAQREQEGSKTKEYEKDGFVSFVVEQKDTNFVNSYVKSAPGPDYCFVCGESTYLPEQSDLCLWCSEKF